MNTLQALSLSAMGGGLYTYGVTLFSEDFWKGFILVGVGILVVIATSILQKHGYPVGK